MLRRSFLQRITYTALLLVFSGMPFALARLLQPNTQTSRTSPNPKITHKKLRPPGAKTDDSAFIAACIGCGLCAEICPPRCIQFYEREGGALANTPFIAPAEKACILCEKCMAVCPTDALTPTDKHAVRMGIAQIDRDACYPWVDHGVCGACVVSCPLGKQAIDFDFANIYRPVVQQGCVGCGVCVEVCPHPSLPIRVVDQPSLADAA
jgi:ferredoxin-type protein NapG